MREQTQKTVRFWYGVFLSVFTVALGIAFLASMSDIYFSAKEGEQIYTRAGLNAHMLPCLIAFCVWVAAVIAGFVLSVVLPVQEKKKRTTASEKIFARLRRRIPQGEGEDFRANLQHVKEADKIRMIAWCACAIVCVALGVVTLVYAFDPRHFASEQNFNGDVLNMAKLVLPCVCAAFACCIVAAVVERVSAKRALPYVKSLIAAGGRPQPYVPDAMTLALQKYETHVLLGVRIAVAVIGVSLLVWGIFNGGANDVFIKATKICSECIGIG